MSHRSLLRPTRLAQSTLALSLSALLTACGGGGEAPPPRAGDEVMRKSLLLAIPFAANIGGMATLVGTQGLLVDPDWG